MRAFLYWAIDRADGEFATYLTRSTSTAAAGVADLSDNQIAAITS